MNPTKKKQYRRRMNKALSPRVYFSRDRCLFVFIVGDFFVLSGTAKTMHENTDKTKDQEAKSKQAKKNNFGGGIYNAAKVVPIVRDDKNTVTNPPFYTKVIFTLSRNKPTVDISQSVFQISP